MAQTWGKNRQAKPLRGDRWTKTDALAARRVLRDAYRARHEFKAAQSDKAATCRLRWVAVVTLLRTVGHTLKSIDARRSPALKYAIQAAWDRWHASPFHHLIFHEFIKRERDMLLKEYRFPAGRLTTAGETAEMIGPSTLLLIGDRSYSAHEALGAALSWWELEIAKIEDDAAAATRFGGAGKR